MIRVANRSSGTSGSRARRSTARKATSGDGGDGDRHEALPARARREQRGDDRDREERRAPDVEPVLVALGALVVGDREHRRAREPERQVHPEDPAPPDGVDDRASDERAHEPGEPPHRPEEPLHPAALVHVEEIADDRERHGLHRARAEPLHRAPRDERPHRARLAAPERPGEEQADPREEDRLAPAEIRELSPDRHGDGGREEVGGERPRVERQAAELRDDGRHRRRDDRHLHRGQEQPEEQRDDGEGAAGPLHRRTSIPHPAFVQGAAGPLPAGRRSPSARRWRNPRQSARS